jgi:hypothetical protein
MPHERSPRDPERISDVAVVLLSARRVVHRGPRGEPTPGGRPRFPRPVVARRYAPTGTGIARQAAVDRAALPEGRAERGRSLTMTAMESGAVRMPMVVGLNLSQAREVISSAVADPQLTIRHIDTGIAPPGMVTSQQPVPGLEVAPDTQIRLTVSSGPTAGDLPSSEP